MSVDDTVLVQRCCAGDRAAFDTLILRYQTPVYNAALRLVGNADDAKDVAQTVFLKVFLHVADFDPQYRFFSWLYRITLNESHNLLGKRRGYAEITGEELDPRPGPEAQAEGGETVQSIDLALRQLSLEHRQVIVLRHVLHLSYEAMAETLQVADKTVKSRLHSARQRMRDLLSLERGV